VSESPESPLVFFTSLELVWKYHDQTFLKLRKRRGQRSRQRKMKALRLRPGRLLDRRSMPWKRTDRASLAEETISQGRTRREREVPRREAEVSEANKQRHDQENRGHPTPA
jgi:hypothetical protein